MADPNMLFDLNLKDADVHDALRDFFIRAERAYVIDDDFDGVVSVRAADLEFDEALHMLLPQGFVAMEVGDVYHIRHQAPTARASSF